MQAQSIEHILKSIEQNNKELKAQKHAADATKMENRTNNNLPDPTVSYSSFYSNGAEGGHGTEFVASQGFDFPTQYIARNRQATLQNEAVDKQQQAARRDILLNAKNLCLDLILLNQEKTLMDIDVYKRQRKGVACSSLRCSCLTDRKFIFLSATLLHFLYTNFAFSKK